MTSIFLSYSSKDKFFVEDLAKKLQDSGIKVWIDNAELDIGDSLIDKIGKAIQENDYIGVILSENSINSEWVQRELKAALNKEIQEKRASIIPILIDKGIEIPIFLKEKVYADFTTSDKYDSSFSKLLKTLRKINTSIYRTVRDPIHHDIELTKFEVDILDSSIMQRLRGLNQLGFAYLVYPGATYSRLSHSIGTLASAKRLMHSIQEQSSFYFSNQDSIIIGGIALLHEITNLPFNYIWNEYKILKEFRANINSYIWFLENDECRRKLGNCFEEIKLYLMNLDNPERLPKPFIAELISETISADLLDYLKRDNYYCGLQLAYDERIFSHFRIKNINEKDHLIIDLKKNGKRYEEVVSEIIDLLRMKLLLTERVYYHHVKVAFDSMLAKALIYAIINNQISEDILFTLNDDSLLYFLSLDKMPEGTKIITKRIMNRERYKRAFVLSRRSFGMGNGDLLEFVKTYSEDNNKRKEFDYYIQEQTKIKPYDYVIYCPSLKIQMKEACVLFENLIRGIIKFTDLHLPELKFLLEQYEQLWTFYVFVYGDEIIRSKVNKACYDFINIPSEYILEY